MSMNLIRQEPWSLLNQLHNEMDRLFQSQRGAETEDEPLARADWVPAIDIKEEDNQYVIHADVPGVDPKDIEVQLENGILTIKGERSTENEEERKGYRRVERVRGSFFRRFNLPDTADQDSVTAKAKNGVLEILIPKQPKEVAKRIAVDSE